MGGEKYFYTGVLVAFIAFRCFAFICFSGNYTDSDQCVMWQMAADFARGEWHTPFFYGQLYSSGLEAWLAAPFIWIGIPVYRAVPLVTFLMSALPWWWISRCAIKNHGYTQGAWVLLGSLLFPITWLQTTYISRGFMQGIFLVSLAAYLWHRANHLNQDAQKPNYKAKNKNPSRETSGDGLHPFPNPTITRKRGWVLKDRFTLRFNRIIHSIMVHTNWNVYRYYRPVPHRLLRPILCNLSIVLGIWGILQNSNAIFILPPILLLFFKPTQFHHQGCLPKSRSRPEIGISLSMVLFFILYCVKSSHPEWIIHKTFQVNFSLKALQSNFTHANDLFQHTFLPIPLLGLILLVLITVLCFNWRGIEDSNTERTANEHVQTRKTHATTHKKKNLHRFPWILLLLLVFPLCLFGIEKTQDGTENIYFGYGRFFLSLPFSWAWFWALTPLKSSIEGRLNRIAPHIKYPVIALLFACQGVAFWHFSSIRYFGKTYIPIMVYPLNQLKQDAIQLQAICKKQKIGAVLIGNHFVIEAGSMGFPQFAKELPTPIIRSKYERRHWILPTLKRESASGIAFKPKKVLMMELELPQKWAKQKYPFKQVDILGNAYIFETGNDDLWQVIQKLELQNLNQ